MELKEFVKQALTEVVEAVREARNGSDRMREAIAPLNFNLDFGMIKAGVKLPEGVMLTAEPGPFLQFIEFDVLVTAGTEAGSKTGIGVLSGIFNAGVGADSKQSGETASRLKFSVPVRFY